MTEAPERRRQGSILWPTLAVAAVVVLFAAGLPLLDALVSPGRRLVRAGTRLVLDVPGDRAIVSDGPAAPQTVRFVPASGWEQLDSTGSDADSVALVRGGITFELDAAASPSNDCETALRSADEDLRALDGSGRLQEAQSFTTDEGLVGLAASFVGTRVEGLTVVVCSDGVAATVVASGSTGALNGARADPVISMAESIEIR